jgi:hypothetical protein
MSNRSYKFNSKNKSDFVLMVLDYTVYGKIL